MVYVIKEWSSQSGNTGGTTKGKEKQNCGFKIRFFGFISALLELGR